MTEAKLEKERQATQLSESRAYLQAQQELFLHNLLPTNAREVLPECQWGEPAPIQDQLEKDTSQLFFVYQDAYVARLSGVLASTLLERASTLVGQERMEQLLLEFTLRKKSSEHLLADVLLEFPEWLAKQEGVEDYLPDVVDTCLKFWALITGPDPEERFPAAPDLNCRLGAHCLFKESRFPLADLWKLSGQEPTESEGQQGRFIEPVSQGLLIVKTTAQSTNTLTVPALLFPLAQALFAGESLERSLEALHVECSKLAGEQEGITQALQDFIAALQQSGALQQPRSSTTSETVFQKQSPQGKAPQAGERATP